MVFIMNIFPCHSIAAIYLNSIPKEDRKGMIDTEKYPASLGVALETCGGILDKDKPLEEIAADEVREECGYVVDPTAFQRIIGFK